MTIRLRNNRRPPVLARLTDGSYLSVTSLLEHRRYPARRLISLYHERWEHESAYYALRHTILHGQVPRSGDPAGVGQEMWHCSP